MQCDMVKDQIPEHIAISIKDDFFIGMKPIYIAECHPEVSQQTVYNLCQSIWDFGTTYPVCRWVLIGRPWLILLPIELELLELLTAHSTYYLDELQYYILTKHSLWVSESIVSEQLNRQSYKVTQREVQHKKAMKNNCKLKKEESKLEHKQRATSFLLSLALKSSLEAGRSGARTLSTTMP